jgi:plasmid stabilization system protein ParE
MNAKPIILQVDARKSISEIMSFYVREGGLLPAARFHGVLHRAIVQIGISPAIGSRRWAEALNMARLRHWRVGHKFPQEVFYIETEDHVRVIDVIHERRDMTQCLSRD